MESFEQFMQRALHDPIHGYYGRRIIAVGARGDFTTAPMLSSLPAKAMAAWAAKALKETQCLNLIEIGPGEGRLAREVMRRLPLIQRLKTRLHLVETSLPLAKRQQELLGSRVIWHEHMSAALAACKGRAVIYSNELVDAFPVRRYQKTIQGWQELTIRWKQGKATEELLPPSPLPVSSGFSPHHPLGQSIEVHHSYHEWLKGWLPQWETGRMLTIDYGATAADLYHRRPRGTLRGYLLQHRLEGAQIYENVGRQDLTADVNFTDLIHWSQPWLESRLMNLADFLRPHAAGHETLLDEQGAGGAFQVLEQWPVDIGNSKSI